MGRADHRQAATGAPPIPIHDAIGPHAGGIPGSAFNGRPGVPSRSPIPARVGAFARALGEGFAELLWPARCVGCDRPGTLLCDACDAALPRIDPRWACPRCGAPFGYLVCTQCDATWTEISRVVGAFAYEGAARDLVRVYKDGHERRLAPLLAELMAEALERSGALVDPGLAVDALTFIPSTTEAFRRRGFDPMEDVAAELAPLVGLPVADVLAHLPVRDQRELSGRERLANVEGSFVVLEDLPGKRLLLIDDVVTTGASIRAAARALAARGASVPLCASVARVW